MLRRFFRFIFLTGLSIGLVAFAVGLTFLVVGYLRITRDLPQLDRISDYQPKAVSQILAQDGTLLAELYEERRYPVAFEEVPQHVRNAFLAAEDANFYQHPGIDFTSIIRALWINLTRKKNVQGASTITQQIVKSLLLSREKTYERKAKEAILSYRIEKALSKDEIFSIYLNEIYLGSNAYGIKAAARAHFHKELNELTIAEAGYLAGLPQKPGELSKLKNRSKAIARQHYVLNQMRRNNFITDAELKQALQEELRIYPPSEQTIHEAPYFAAHAMKVATELLPSIDPKISITNPGGYTIRTTANVPAHHIAQRALRAGLRDVDKRRGWRGPIGHMSLEDYQTKFHLPESLEEGEPYKALIQSINSSSGYANVLIGQQLATLPLKEAGWAKKRLGTNDHSYYEDITKSLHSGDVIEISVLSDSLTPTSPKKGPLRVQLDQTPDIEGAFTLVNPFTGDVEVLVGGYEYSSADKFNRATQALRQPGSAFKPFIYLSALMYLNYTPSTIVPDSPVSLIAGNGKLWSPKNFDNKYLGPITLRTALQRSRNVVSVFLLRQVGLPRVIELAHKMGITSNIAPNMSIALGTSEVTLLELVRAYGVFPAGGWLADETVVKSIEDRNGKSIYRKRPAQKQVIGEDLAFLMAHLMKGVVERGTATVVKQLARPAAGKTGTTNDLMDAWFVGYTPQWAAGAWVGFDQKKKIGPMETGGKVSAPIFLHFMQEFLKDSPAIDFDIPDGVVPVAVDLNSGRPVDPSAPGAFIEYFRLGNEPQPTDSALDLPKDYLSSDEF